jgi:hypothetical protein
MTPSQWTIRADVGRGTAAPAVAADPRLQSPFPSTDSSGLKFAGSHSSFFLDGNQD